jgi:hypothetical protein
MSVGAARPYRHRRGKRYRTRCRPGRLRNSPRPEIVNASPPSGVRHGSFDAHGRPPHKLMRHSIVTPSGLTSRRPPRAKRHGCSKSTPQVRPPRSCLHDAERSLNAWTTRPGPPRKSRPRAQDNPSVFSNTGDPEIPSTFTEPGGGIRQLHSTEFNPPKQDREGELPPSEGLTPGSKIWDGKPSATPFPQSATPSGGSFRDTFRPSPPNLCKEFTKWP